VPTVLVCGHSGCTAMQSLLHGAADGDSSLARWLRWGLPSMGSGSPAVILYHFAARPARVRRQSHSDAVTQRRIVMSDPGDPGRDRSTAVAPAA